MNLTQAVLVGGIAYIAYKRLKKRKTNPAAKRKARRNPAPARQAPKAGGRDRKAYETARRLSETFHGDAQVVELTPAERKGLPRFVAVAGDMEDFTYAPKPGSKRAGYNWKHESGDRGFGRGRGKRKPLIVIDPDTKRPAIVSNRSGMTFEPEIGFIG